ncbi:MAG: hypothetical protein HY270_04545 [Deltaproteobacteria bacterium]|nr:hypothetical protein [Deltaproteobacteria bacterium]
MLLLVLYLAIFAWLPRHVFWNPDEGAKYFILNTIGWDGGLTYTLPYRGARLDPQMRFYPRRSSSARTNLYPSLQKDGTVGLRMPVWFPGLTVLPFRWLGLPGLYLIPLLSGLLTSLVAGWLTYGLAPILAPVAILVVGLATPLCFYSFCFWEHALATALGTTAVALLARSAGRPGATVVLIMLLSTLMLLLRLEMLAFVVALLVAWAVVARRRASDDCDGGEFRAASRPLVVWALFALGLAAVCALPLWLPLLPERHYQRVQSIPEVLELSVPKLKYLPSSVVGLWINLIHGEAPALPETWAWTGLIGVFLCFGAAFVGRARLQAWLIVSGLVLVLAVSSRLLLWTYPYRALDGFFPVAPALCVFAFGLVDGWQRRDYALLTLATVAAAYLAVATLAVFAFYVDSAGGYDPALEWGPRFLLTLYPLATVVTLVAMHRYWVSARTLWLKRVVVGMVMFGICLGLQFEARGLIMLRGSRVLLASWESALPATQPVVTDIWWLPSALAPFFVSHEMYYTERVDDLREWIALAARNGIDSFTFAGHTSPEIAALGAVDRQAQDNVAGLQLDTFRIRHSQ